MEDEMTAILLFLILLVLLHVDHHVYKMSQRDKERHEQRI